MNDYWKCVWIAQEIALAFQVVVFHQDSIDYLDIGRVLNMFALRMVGGPSNASMRPDCVSVEFWDRLFVEAAPIRYDDSRPARHLPRTLDKV